MIGHGFIALFLSLLFVAAAEAQSLKIADRKGAKSFTAEQLLASPLARNVTIAKDPVHGRSMTYRVIPLTELLKGLEAGPQDYVDFVATDKFSIGIPARLLLRPGNPAPHAFLAIENPAAPWPAMPDKGKETAAPFYLVWQDAKPGEISSEYWVYKLAAIEVADSPYTRWPSLDVAEDLPATHPARRGLDRYVALCISCHRFKGAGAGEQGPDLGQPMNPVDYFQPQALRTFLRSSKQVRDWPDRKMPSFNQEVMSDEDMEALIAWLTYKARR
ncbi:MAG: cytochrome c [Alphaproteobacteria bacterium]|nr:MAG: cytochrome c [Alphaproteobacteria bacterium]